MYLTYYCRLGHLYAKNYQIWKRFDKNKFWQKHLGYFLAHPVYTQIRIITATHSLFYVHVHDVHKRFLTGADILIIRRHRYMLMHIATELTHSPQRGPSLTPFVCASCHVTLVYLLDGIKCQLAEKLIGFELKLSFQNFVIRKTWLIITLFYKR